MMSAKSKNNNNNNNATLKLSGLPRPGEAIRAVLLGHLNLDSNADATIEFQWYRKEYTTEQEEEGEEGEERGKQRKRGKDQREQLNEDEREIPGATAPIYLVRKVDNGCRIGALAILRSSSPNDDFEDDDKDGKRKKESSKVLATFKSEMSDIVHMESDDEDEDYYGEDASGGERKQTKKSWRKLQQRSKTATTSSTTTKSTTTSSAAVKTIPKHPHYEEKRPSASSSSSSSALDAFETTKRSGDREDGTRRTTGKSAVTEKRRRQTEGNSPSLAVERSKKAEERLLANSRSFFRDKDDESVNDYLLFGEKEEYERTNTKNNTTSSPDRKFEDDEIYVDVLRKLKAYARLRIRHMGHFSKLLKFATFCVLYCTMLYLQTDPILSFEVSSTVRGLLKPKIKSTQDVNYIYEWLSESVVDPIWTEAPCGDGVCSAPYEFPAFGRFGCKADCGSATNLISLVIHVQSRFGNSPAVSALELMSQASWNLCLQDPGRYANDLPDLCWYEKDQKFLEVDTNTLIRFDVIAGNWYVRLKGDHLGLVAGKIYRLEENGDLVLTPTVPLWLTCTKTSLFKNVQARISKFASASPSPRSVKRESSSTGRTGTRGLRSRRWTASLGSTSRTTETAPTTNKRCTSPRTRRP